MEDKQVHAMLDLETLDVKATGVIMSIGAVAFDPMSKELGSKFYTVISVDDCVARGLTTSKDTIGWWMKQSPEARSVMTEAKESNITLQEALTLFSRWWGDNKLKYLWSNGSGFDAPILANAYFQVGMKTPWFFTNELCHRTMRTLMSHIEEPVREGVYHNALDDAIHQVHHSQKMFKDW